MSEYLNRNFILEPNNQETIDNLRNYKKLIEERYEGYKKVIYRYYNLFAAPYAAPYVAPYADPYSAPYVAQYGY